MVADWLSRPPGVPLGKAYDIENEDTIGSIQLEIISHKELAKAQEQCPDVKAHREQSAKQDNGRSGVFTQHNALLQNG